MKQFDGPLLSRRILFFAASSFLLGILLAEAVGWSWLIFLGIGAGCIGLHFLFGRKMLIWAMITVCMAGAAYFSAYMEAWDAAPSWEEEATVTGRISEAEPSGNSMIYRLTEATANGESIGDVRLTDYSGQGFSVDDLVTFHGTLKRPKGAGYPFGFDSRLYYAAIGVDYTATASDMVKQGEAADWRSSINDLREEIGEKMDELLGSKAAIGKALFLGMDEALSDQTMDSFRDTGISHILCVSGLHVCIIAGVLSFLLNKLNINKKLYIGLLMGFLLFYIALTGLKTSAIRAGLMFALYTVATYLARRPDSLTLLSAAFLAFALGNPAAVFDASLQLSFAAIFGILCVSPVVERALPKKLASLASTLGATLGATLGTAPISINMSNKFWLPSALLNLVVIAYGAVLIPVLFVVVMLYCICPPLLAWTGDILQAMLGLLQTMSTGAELLPQLMLTIKSTWGIVLLGLLAGLFLCSRYVNLRGRVKVAGMAVILALGVGAWCWVPPAGGDVSIAFLDVGRGESALISTASGKRVLIDTGNGSGAATYLRKQGLQADMTFLTKLRTDHAGGLDGLMEEGLQGQVYSSEANAELLELKYQGEAFYGLEKGDIIQIDEENALQAVWLGEGEDGALVLLLLHRGEGLCLFMSDAALEDERAIQGEVKSDIIKLGRNGRSTATSPELLERAAPRLAVMTSNGGTLADTGDLPVYDTREDGTVTVTVTEGQIEVKTADEG